MNAQSLVFLQANWELKQQLCAWVGFPLWQLSKGASLFIRPCILLPVMMPSICVQSRLLSLVRYLDTLLSFITISSQFIYMAACPYFKATNVLQLVLESIACSSLIFLSQSQPWFIKPLSTVNNFELCFSISHEFPISYSLCSASIPTPTTMPISVCRQALQSWRCVWSCQSQSLSTDASHHPLVSVKSLDAMQSYILTSIFKMYLWKSFGCFCFYSWIHRK